jgi:mRNA interferase MazF
MVIGQGDVFMVHFGPAIGSAPALRRPAVVVQSDRFNRSEIATVLVCPLTSNLEREHAVGNVRIGRGEANLPKPSVVLTPSLVSIDRTRLGEKLGTLPKQRVREIIAGINLVIAMPD